MTSFGSAHPLDVDLGDLADGTLDRARAAAIDAHLTGCALCRIKRVRLAGAPPPAQDAETQPVASTSFEVPAIEEGDELVAGEIRLVGGDQRLLVLVLEVGPHTVLVTPVTFDVEAADDESVVVGGGRSPLPTAMVLHPALAAHVPREVVGGRLATLTGPAELPGLLAGHAPETSRGPAIAGPTDPRLELRQHLVDLLGSLDATPAVDADRTRTALIDDLRAFRGPACAVRTLDAWDGLMAADAAEWAPLATIDEVGVVLVVLDTPHGLVDDADFDTARAVLTRCNATALVVLARGLSELADVFDASALNFGIDMPSGAHTPPRPLISGLVPFDAIAKFLDQHSGARAMSPPTRGPVARVDVADVLRAAAVAAVADAVRQGGRFKILPKRRGYESLAAAPDALGDALALAFTDASVVDGLLELAGRTGEDEAGG